MFAPVISPAILSKFKTNRSQRGTDSVVSFVRGWMGLATLLLFPYVTGEAGRKYDRYMPWPQAAECNMITNKQTGNRFNEVKIRHYILMEVPKILRIDSHDCQCYSESKCVPNCHRL